MLLIGAMNINTDRQAMEAALIQKHHTKQFFFPSTSIKIGKCKSLDI